MMRTFSMSLPHLMGSCGSVVGSGLFLSFGGGKCFAKDL